MVVDGINRGTPSWTAGETPRGSTSFRLSVENNQADTGRDWRIRLARSNSQVETGTRKIQFSLFS